MSFTLGPLVELAGYTVEDVKQVRDRDTLVLDPFRAAVDCASPALASDAARMALGAKDVDFVGLNQLGWPVYKAVSA